MENQKKKETSLEYFYERIIIMFEFNSDTYISIQSDLNEAKKMYEEEIENAYKKGYLQGAGDFLKPFKNQIWENLKNNYLLEQFNKNK